jgi:hypothetical protein
MARKSASSPFERKKPSLKTQARVLVICEDTKSSLQYLKDAAYHFRAYAEVDIVHCGKNDPLGIVEEAVERQRFFDHVYCAIDRDTHENFDEALVLAKLHKKKISIIASYPCYEFWLLLHFQKCQKPYRGIGKNSSGDLLLKDLCKELGMESYAKGKSKNLFDQLIDRLPKARQRAREVMDDVPDNGLNLSTQLHELIQRFEKLSKPESI